jgi:chemotaxis-related protein WspB
MLFLLFQIANDVYALDTRQIVEVLPLVNVKRIPQAPKAVSGLFTYHGTTIPLVDLSQLVSDIESHRVMSTRIVVLRYSDPRGRERTLGLIIEKTRSTLRRSETDFEETDVAGAAFLGGVTRDGDRIVQRVFVEHLLSSELVDQLFQALT